MSEETPQEESMAMNARGIFPTVGMATRIINGAGQRILYRAFSSLSCRTEEAVVAGIEESKVAQLNYREFVNRYVRPFEEFKKGCPAIEAEKTTQAHEKYCQILFNTYKNRTGGGSPATMI